MTVGVAAGAGVGTGAGVTCAAATVTVTDDGVLVNPDVLFVQVIMYVEFPVTVGYTVEDPLALLNAAPNPLPTQSFDPEAVQPSAFELDHVRFTA